MVCQVERESETVDLETCGWVGSGCSWRNVRVVKDLCWLGEGVLEQCVLRQEVHVDRLMVYQDRRVSELPAQSARSSRLDL